MNVAVLFLALVGSQCALGLSLSFRVPTIDKNGSTKFNIGLSKDGLALVRHHESYTEELDHDEQQNSTTNEHYKRDDNSSELTREQNNTEKIRELRETNQKSQDTGFTLSKGGLNLFNNKKEVESKTASEQESGRSSAIIKDRNATAGHVEEFGSEYNKSYQMVENKEEYDNKGLTLLGPGGLLSKSKERGTSETRDVSRHEDGSTWEQTKDLTKDGNKVNMASSNHASNYTQDSKDSSATSTHEKEIKVYKRENEEQDGDDNDKENGGNDLGSKLLEIKEKSKEVLGMLFG